MEKIQALTPKKSTIVQLIIGGLATLLSIYLVYEVRMVITLLEATKEATPSVF